jgi:hypothetical protein
MIQLTDEQKEVILKFGRSSEIEVVHLDVLDELLKLGLIYKRSDEKLDFTEAGEQIYDQLAK